MIEFGAGREPEMIYAVVIPQDRADEDVMHLLETCNGRMFYDPYLMDENRRITPTVYFTDEQAAVMFRMYFG